MNIRTCFGISRLGVLMAAGPGRAPYDTAQEPFPSDTGVRRHPLGRRQEPSVWWQIVVYATLLLSVLASHYVDFYNAHVPEGFLHEWKYILCASMISFVLFPTVYRKVRHGRNDPLLVQLGVIFTAGMGWEKMLSTVADALKSYKS